MPNIVQAEFFHVGGRSTDSLEDLFDEIAERTQENYPLALAGIETNAGIKTAVRFFDQEDRLTTLTKRFEMVTGRCTAIHDRIDASPTKVGRWFLQRRLRRLYLFKLALRRQIEQVVITSCITVLQTNEPFGVERADRSFRAIKSEERYELKEKVRESKGVWLFIFKPNYLFANKNEIIVSMM